MTSTVVTTRLTREEANDKGLIPNGHGWDEKHQRAVPIGSMVAHDTIERGVDLAQSLEAFVRNRDIVLRFIANQMDEAEYDKKGYPVPGKLHDFYKLPNYDKKALTKQGSEKLAQFARARRSATRSIERQCTKDFTMAVVQVELTDPFGQVMGSGESACTTAERGFSSDKVKAKYNGDYRAAMNDVLARAGKRAFVQAVIYATATDEIFDTAGDVEKAAEGSGITEEVEEGFRLPQSAKLAADSGRLVKSMSTEELTSLRDRMKAKLTNPGAWQSTLDAIDQELDSRRQTAGDEELPF